MFPRGAIALALAAGAAGLAYADEVQFSNGDRITGKIVTVDGGKMKIKSAIAGEVEVDMKDVKTFTTDGPIEIRMKDNTTINQKVTAAGDGQVKVEQGTVQAQTLPLANVKKVNPKESWEGSVVAGALFARGNTTSDAVNVGFDITKRTEKDRIHFDGQYLYGRQKDQSTGEKSTTTDNWKVFGKYDYFFNEKLYGFASLLLERDRIADLDIRMIPSVGVGYQWVDQADFHFSTEGGLAYTYERYKDSDDSNGALSLRLAYHVDKKLNDKVGVFHNLEYYPSLEDISDYLLKADAGIRADFTEKLFMEAKVQYNYDSTPATGAHETDLRYLLGLGWKL